MPGFHPGVTRDPLDLSIHWSPDNPPTLWDTPILQDGLPPGSKFQRGEFQTQIRSGGKKKTGLRFFNFSVQPDNLEFWPKSGTKKIGFHASLSQWSLFLIYTNKLHHERNPWARVESSYSNLHHPSCANLDVDLSLSYIKTVVPLGWGKIPSRFRGIHPMNFLIQASQSHRHCTYHMRPTHHKSLSWDIVVIVVSSGGPRNYQASPHS